MKYLFSILALIALASFVNPHQPNGQPGDTASDFKLRNIDGRWVTLHDFRKSKGVIIVFTCNHCPYAQAYEQRIIELHKEFAEKGYPVVAINPNDPLREPEDSYENMQKRAKEKQYPFVYLFDEKQTTAKNYGATRTPHVFLLKNQGKSFKVVYTGTIDDNYEEPQSVQVKYVKQAIEELENNKPVGIPATKAIGCGIKWKKE